MNTYIAWMYEGDGWVSYEISANSYAEAIETTRERFAGTRGAWTLEVEAQPVRARA